MTIWLTFRIARHLWHEGRAVFVGISVLCYVPFYQYAMFLYTDVPGICIAVLFLYCAVLFEKCSERSKKVFYAGAIGILASLAIYIKLTAFIVFVAIMIAYLMKHKIKMMVLYGSIAGIFLLLGSTVIGSQIDHTLQFDRSEALRHEFPPAHWIMMMLNTSGGYQQEDVDYTKSYTSYEDKVSAQK
jgi:4-amino-4-deoxy-L-arabinose transferase and related glycosyltransferases of PMT family